MDLPIKQLNRLINSAQHILITGPKNPSLDVLSSAIAWQIFLSSQKKKVDIVFSGKVNSFAFLPKVKIENNLGNLDKFKIILDISKNKVKQLSYDVSDDRLVIDIVPETGTFSAKDVSSERGEYKYDLVIVLGAESLENLGEIFFENRNFFHSRAIINIDTSVLNENFGQLDIVESSATSLAEISYNALIKYLNKDIATCLLAGMISATNSFQSAKVNPNTLEIASQLVIKGGEREKIVESLYRTKDIDTLKSWGKVLSRLRKNQSIISSFLRYEDLDKAADDFEELVRELILSTPQAQLAVIYYQVETNQTEAHIYSANNINALDLVRDLSTEGNRRLAKVSIDKDLEDSQEYLQAVLSKKLQIINAQS